jgi:hypothetical protein
LERAVALRCPGFKIVTANTTERTVDLKDLTEDALEAAISFCREDYEFLADFYKADDLRGENRKAQAVRVPD